MEAVPFADFCFFSPERANTDRDGCAKALEGAPTDGDGALNDGDGAPSDDDGDSNDDEGTPNDDEGTPNDDGVTLFTGDGVGSYAVSEGDGACARVARGSAAAHACPGIRRSSTSPHFGARAQGPGMLTT